MSEKFNGHSKYCYCDTCLAANREELMSTAKPQGMPANDRPEQSLKDDPIFGDNPTHNEFGVPLPKPAQVEGREWWLIETQNKFGEKYVCDIVYENKPNNPGAFKVIEKSAYDRVCKERDEALENNRGYFDLQVKFHELKQKHANIEAGCDKVLREDEELRVEIEKLKLAVERVKRDTPPTPSELQDLERRLNAKWDEGEPFSLQDAKKLWAAYVSERETGNAYHQALIERDKLIDSYRDECARYKTERRMLSNALAAHTTLETYDAIWIHINDRIARARYPQTQDPNGDG